MSDEPTNDHRKSARPHVVPVLALLGLLLPPVVAIAAGALHAYDVAAGVADPEESVLHPPVWKDPLVYWVTGASWLCLLPTYVLLCRDPDPDSLGALEALMAVSVTAIGLSACSFLIYVIVDQGLRTEWIVSTLNLLAIPKWLWPVVGVPVLAVFLAAFALVLRIRGPARWR